MIFRKAGKIPQPLSVISLGGAALGSNAKKVYFNRAVSVSQAIATVHCALDCGVNLIDTSPAYGDSETKIGLAIHEYGRRESFLISTKVGSHPAFGGFDSDSIKRSIEASLHNLQTDYLDIVHLHDPNQQQFETILSHKEAIDTLLKLKQQKVLRYIGLGVRDHSMHKRFIETGMADIVLPYLDCNLLRNELGPVFALAQNQGVGIVLGSALCMGYLSGQDPKKIHVSHYNIANEINLERVYRMYDWCKKKGDVGLLPAINFAFILKNLAVASIVIGAASADEIKKNIDWALNFDKLDLYDEFMIEFGF